MVDATRKLGVSRQTVLQRVKRGDLEAVLPKLSDFFDCCSVFGQRGETSLVSVYRPAEMIRVWAAERENDFGRVLLPI